MPRKPQPNVCGPCRDRLHGDCEGAAVCACPPCREAREWSQLAHDQIELLWPLEPKEK